MKWNRWFLAGVLGVAMAFVSVGLVAVLALKQHQADMRAQDEFALESADQQLPSMWQAPSFAYPDQNGRQLTEKDLIGRVWIANFIFTQCTAVCPTMTAKMVLLQHDLTDSNVRFVSFSVDPAHDTVPVLQQYAQQWNADETRWHLLQTTPDALQATARGFKVAVAPSNEIDNPIMHSNLFFLMDQDGQVRGIYNSGDRETMDRLAAHAKKLASGATAAPTARTIASLDGKGIYSAMGCAACHVNPQLGPPLEHLVGRTVQLTDGSSLLADESYLRESIVDPHAKVVVNYRKTMPSYDGHLDAAAVDKLVAYLKTLGPDSGVVVAGSTTAPVQLVTDPVCKMRITVNSTSRQSSHDGTTYYFCSQSCLDRFNVSPTRFVPKP